MKTKFKVLIAAACAILLVVASVAGTLAYLTSTTTEVVNTFTFGKIAITLDEAQVDEYGVEVAGADRVTANNYKLMPGHNYTKDPTIHVAADSEESYLFVKVVDGIAAIEADVTIADQMLANGWAVLEGDVWYYTQTVSTVDAAAIDVPVFGEFTITDDAAVDGYENASINVTAYAVQADGFADAATAWAAANLA